MTKPESVDYFFAGRPLCFVDFVAAAIAAVGSVLGV